ncbi:malto-oligosyltrehalose synthase [Pseudomonas sp. H9]|uniref:malto-oligosyltrehalose synthase n=1 Tax=Pseudomonas sp. H9 TaxID=483968 RepID=UPI001057E4B9|nr:malto-oligosyltrehalose synthase [Pseudomonas sp. H9]TDF81548.1 malto-oligosyltrehalose synthase [Pseudomonas sp. H9]
MSALNATLRLQFHAGFSLDDALPLVPYFARLGISHLYASPLLSARPGSMHGYDVIDPTQVNPALGGEAALARLVAALRAHGMGLILDIVSNHMAVSSDNPWWQDLLTWGRRSRYSRFFDIQWHSTDPLLEGQLLLPFLATDYAAALRAGDTPLCFQASDGRFYIRHHEHRFPLNPCDYGHILGVSDNPALQALGTRFTALQGVAEATTAAALLQQELAALARRVSIDSLLEAFDGRTTTGFERLHQLLEQQAYRLASWRTAADDINWRRFFDINELAGLRVERPEVFEATHEKIFELIGKGLIDGLRIDHIDGLADPRGYCRKLRRRVDALLAQRPLNAALEHFPLYVEKILGANEQLHQDWGVDGTTGYEFMNQVSLLQHDPAGESTLSEAWSALSERPAFAEEVRLARQQVLGGSLAGDFESVAQALLQVARDDLISRDLTLGAIRRALQALVEHYPVYRTYLHAGGCPAEDAPLREQALAAARQSLNEGDWPVLDALEGWLGGQPWRRLPLGLARKHLRHACIRFQQLTAPTAAKAVEDTAFYRSAVLLSRNDVGFAAERFSAPVCAFHHANSQRQAQFPHNLLCTATHDHKRGEDHRARLAVLSERSEWFVSRVEHWRELATPLRSALADGIAPGPADEWMLYQTLLGSWPMDLNERDPLALQAYAERLQQWQRKALREAKLRSSWSAPNEACEHACLAYIHSLLLDPQNQQLRHSLAQAANAIACAGALNSLGQCLLRMTAPGVPDLYQGSEFWDLSLVDPDNRRAVDYSARRQALDDSTHTVQLLQQWRNGRIKQALISQVLERRRQYTELFAQGRYLPVQVLGRHAEQVVAFARISDEARALVIVPRLACGLLGDTPIPLIPAQNWDDTRLRLPFDVSPATCSGLFASSAVTASKELLLSAALKEFPVNLLIDHA